MNKTPLLRFRFVVVNVVVLMLLTGCAKKQMNLTKTGFLSSYSDLKEEGELDGMLIYRNPKINTRERYSKIMVAPVQFKLDPMVKEHKMGAEDRVKLADYFHEKLMAGLVKNFEIASEPGHDVLLFRTAITDILPNKIYLNLHWTTTLYGAGIGGASLEAELVDSLTGEQIMAFIDARKGRKLNYTKGLTKWGHTKEVMGLWADVMVTNLEQLKEKYIGRTAEIDIHTGAEL
jgi:hypothetical protein